jgi:hypothetical protein
MRQSTGSTEATGLCALRRCPRCHAVFHAQLRAGDVAGAAVAPVDAAPVRAQQPDRDRRRFQGFQAQHRFELPRSTRSARYSSSATACAG